MMGKVTVQPVQGRQTTYAAGNNNNNSTPVKWVETRGNNKDCYLLQLSKGGSNSRKQCTKPKRTRDDTWPRLLLCAISSRNGSDALTDVLKNLSSEESSESMPKLYDGNTILKMILKVVPDSDETLKLSEESRSKMLLKEQDPLFYIVNMPMESDFDVPPFRPIFNLPQPSYCGSKKNFLQSCPSINNCGPQLIEAMPRKKDKQVRFAESLTSTENTKPVSTSNVVSNKRVLHSIGVRLSTSASGSQPSGNTKNDRILQTPSSNSKNKVEAHPRNVKSSLNKKNGNVNVHGSAVVQNLKKQDNSD
ncbi:hypothetical protein Tco_1104924 [Tanacetum coccineum]